jgi:hypothetical protein
VKDRRVVHFRGEDAGRDRPARYRWLMLAGESELGDDKVPDLDQALVEAAMEDGWSRDTAVLIGDAARRRWRSFSRRHPRRSTFDDRVRDLVRGLKQRSPVDPIYVEPVASIDSRIDSRVYLRA